MNNETNSLTTLPRQKQNAEEIIEAGPRREIPAFIEANTSAISLAELNERCIVPSFADLSPTISHANFASIVRQAANNIFANDTFSDIECRVSHQINGRTPDALNIPAKNLKANQITTFYQRFCFCFEILTQTSNINGQDVSLVVGGLRSLHETNLYSKKSPEKFRIFIGYRVHVCSNMMLTCDGLSEKLECMTEADIFQHAMMLFSRFNKEKTLSELEFLSQTTMTTEQFCQFIGKCRLYAALSDYQRRELNLPQILLGDSLLNAATRGFVTNPNFGVNGTDMISCWQLMQLLNDAARQSYIDVWADRNRNATDISIGIQKALRGEDDSYSWFIN